MKRKVAVVAVALACLLPIGSAVAEERSPILEKICEAAPGFCKLWQL
ncbi:hypothetical protein [Lysobacter sp. A3-1-A15]